MPTKGYFVEKKIVEDKSKLIVFPGYSDEEHEGFEFFTEIEYLEQVEDRFWCPDAGYITEPIPGCYSGMMGFCSRCK